MEGLAEVLEMETDYVFKMHVLIELYKGQFLAQSSIIGTWGDALKVDKVGNVVHGHTLDWDMNSPYRDAHQITVYHPNNGHSYISVGWTGFVGVVTGISFLSNIISL